MQKLNKRQKRARRYQNKAQFIEYLNSPVSPVEVIVAFAIAGIFVMLIAVLAAKVGSNL